ncbi:MAG: hypothetical protein ACLURV_05425 [Gallintestinimicrobium sp.]
MKKDVGTSILKNYRAGKPLQLKFRRTIAMDPTERKMTKIARELNKLTVQTMKEEGIGTAEFDFIHLVRHHQASHRRSCGKN